LLFVLNIENNVSRETLLLFKEVFHIVLRLGFVVKIKNY